MDKSNLMLINKVVYKSTYLDVAMGFLSKIIDVVKEIVAPKIIYSILVHCGDLFGTEPDKFH